ncbi:hypothetical protein EJB05_37487, partial [Eragrostis curvula]
MSDVGKLNRLLIPKQHAEKYFPTCAAANEKGLLLNLEDRTGKIWRFLFSYWNSSQSYVMTKGWNRFVREKQLDSGDTVSFFSSPCESARQHRLFIDWKRRADVRDRHRLSHIGISDCDSTDMQPSLTSALSDSSTTSKRSVPIFGVNLANPQPGEAESNHDDWCGENYPSGTILAEAPSLRKKRKQDPSLPHLTLEKGSISADELGMAAERCPAKRTGLRGFYEAETASADLSDTRKARLSTIQQTLTPEAAAALTRAIDEAARRRHGQTTPLHVAAALLAAPAGLLSQACARVAAGTGAGAGQGGEAARALELCFSVALDRLPAAAAAAGQGMAPPVSNALVAALKRAHVHQQRGGPKAAQQPLLAIKVELKELVLSILDDPSVSRVMREASFSSAAVKSTIEQSLSSPSPASSAAAVPFPAAAPVALSPFSSLSPPPFPRDGTAKAYLNPRLADSAGGGMDARKVIDVMLRPARRNPVLVGDSGPDAVLEEAIRRIPTAGSPALVGAKVLPLEAELAKLASDKVAMAARIVELGAVVDMLLVEHSGVVLDLGDLKWLVGGPAAAASEGGKLVVAEMARLLRRFGGGKVWAVATAACATYLRCKVYHPAMEAEWDLQAVPITRARGAGAASRPEGTGIIGNSVGMLPPMAPSLPHFTSENASADEFGMAAEGCPAKGTGLSGFYEAETAWAALSEIRKADLSTIQQTLTPEAAAALARAIDEAARRRHGQTTPLHVAAALLAAPAGLLRQACARAAAADGAQPLQCRALELCFSVALDRLPVAAAAARQGAAPPVSNALVAALKRAQAQQLRGCPEAPQQPLLAIKVELEQLVLSILDDRSVSRVMREASFSSAAVKITIEQSLSSPSPASSAAAVPSPAAAPRRQFCDIKARRRLRILINGIMFLVKIQATVGSRQAESRLYRNHQARNQNWIHGSSSTDELGMAQRWPAEGIDYSRDIFTQMWTQDLESDFSEATKVVKRQRLARNQFHDITPREKLKRCLNVVQFVVKIQAIVRGSHAQKNYSTQGSGATHELGIAKGTGLRVYHGLEAFSWHKERQSLDKHLQSSTLMKESSLYPRHKYLHSKAKIEKPHSTFHEDVNAWIATKKQHQEGLHHICGQQVRPKLHGRNDIKQMIMDNILFDRKVGSNCTVICINAGSGHGKTSLLRVLYDDQQLMDVFDRRIWIQMHDYLDISVLLRKIVEFSLNDHCSVTSLMYLQEMVEEEITDKKIVLFLDDADIEDQQFWNSALEVLNASARGSIVVMATKRATVASLTGVATHSYFLSPLSEENNLMLLQQYAPLGTDIRSNPDLVVIAKRLISRFGANPLNLKAIGGLLCHTDIISLQKDTFEGSVIPLQLCHDVLPIHLKKCLAFCSLFPKGYIFDRHHIILLWISHGCVKPIEGCELEDVGAEYFNDLLCRSFFQHSPFHNDKDEKFVMHELIYKVVESVSQNRYFNSEDLMGSVPENILHLSLVSSQIQTVQLMLRTEKLKDLQTFLVVQPEGQQYKISVPSLNLVGLDDFFLKFTSLETLDLGHTDIEEIPGSIVSMRNLQYLSMNNTSIRALPSELCILGNLQTLKAKDCRFLTELPGDTKNLLKLRHLDVTKKLGHVVLPNGIGQLTELRTLPVFHASGESSHCCITELGSLHNLRGCLRLSGLDSVKTSSKAQEVNLKSKQHLKDLTLQWHDGGTDIDDDDLNDEVENVAEQVLEGLQPHANLQELAIRSYEGSAFPAWMQGSSSLPNLVSLTLDDCCNCTQFPAIYQLPSLKFLSIRKMYYVQQLISDINGGTKFPSLVLLNLWEMYGLEELFEASEGDCPRLHKICISRCPDLKRLPSVPSVNELVLHCGLQLPDIPELGSLASLKIESFHGVKSFSLTPPALSVLKKLEIKSCNELSSIDGLEALTTVQRLKIAGCPKLVLPRIRSLAS